jgi:hypothetical protein
VSVTTAAKRAGISSPSIDYKSGLLLTDYMIAMSLILSAFWVLDPMHLALDRIAVVKHFPLVVLLGTLLFGFFGARLFPRTHQAPTVGGPWGLAGPLVAFAGVVAAGSLYGRFRLDIDNTFLNMGLFILVVPLMASIVKSMSDPVHWTRIFFLGVGAVAAADGVLQWIDWGTASYFHGSEFIVLPVAVYLWFSRVFWPLKVIGVLFFLSLAAAEHKNTGYLIVFFLLVYCTFWAIRIRLKSLSDPFSRTQYQGLAVLTGVVSVVIALSLFALRGVLFPDGNPDYRLHTYQRAFEKFLESPLVGNVFSGPASERFDLYQVAISYTNILPTHSDVLDILANGGVVLSLLFLAGLWRIFRLLFSTIDNATLEKTKAYLPALHGCFAVFLTGIITLVFNPVLTQPNSALMLWASLGIGVGLALHLKHEALKEIASLWTRRPPPSHS